MLSLTQLHLEREMIDEMSDVIRREKYKQIDVLNKVGNR